MAGREEACTREGRDQRTRKRIGEQIKFHRNKQAMTQEELAEKIGGKFSSNSLSRYENGSTEMGIVTFVSLASALNLEPNDLVPSELITGFKSTAGPKDYEKLSDENKDIVNILINALLCKQEGQK